MAHMENLSIGVFIDGGYYAKINEGLARTGQGTVNLKNLLKIIPELIGKEYGIPRNIMHITEAHYYRGRFRAKDAEKRNLLLEEREFEDMLIENDVLCHYKHLREDPRGGIIEKGIDTWFALDTYELTIYRNLDYVVLISGDADHEMLARKLKALKAHVMLLTWDPAHTGSTSRFLSEEVCAHIDIGKLISESQETANRLITRQ
ncbi:MAG: NYN domain-containing protein [Bacteroidales bacterium]|nr:NYN domain-containing protein [Bacteroidales bacterium]